MDATLKIFSDTLLKIRQKDLAAALSLIVPYAKTHPYVLYTEDIDGVEENFRLMIHYMEQGADDPMREKMYEAMLEKVKRAVRNMRADYRRRNVDFYHDAQSHVGNGMPMSEKAIKLKLEDYVSDVAILQLESGTERELKAKDIYAKHYAFMQSLFCSIVVSDLWTQDQASEMKDILLSPTIDTDDAQMIVGALMLATMNNFDINKFRVLVDVSRQSLDDTLRQKALIGWVFSMTDSIDVAEQKSIIADLCQDARMTRDLVDLQKQVIFCMNAERDNATIQRDIMPTLIRNSNLNVTRLGITEKEEDPMQDILDPEAQDRAMEETEEKFQKMIEMQKSGADIYFGGFSQMKRFPFFYVLSNWFCPFSIHHPDIARSVDKLKGVKVLESLLATGPFCDSDKYSFAIALVGVFDRLPENVREMLGSGELIPPNVDMDKIRTPAYLRRQSLQDLYRFFRLYRWHEQIYNPFTEDACLFMSSSLFIDTPLAEQLVEIGKFLMKNGRGKMVERIIPALENVDTKDSCLVRGVYHLDHSGNCQEAMRCFGRVLEQYPDDIQALTGYAKSALAGGDVAKACDAYSKLYAADSDKKSMALDYAIALAKTQRFDDAAKVLFRLDFKYPDSPNVRRVLAWTLMGQGKMEQAEKNYCWLLAKENVSAMDYLNAGYCKWFVGNRSEAAERIATFCRMQKKLGKSSEPTEWRYADVAEMIGREFSNDEKMLDLRGVSHVERILMKTMVFEKLK